MPVPESRTTSRCKSHQIYPKILQSGSIAQAFFNSPRNSRLELLRVLGTRNFRHIFRIDNHKTFLSPIAHSYQAFFTYSKGFKVVGFSRIGLIKRLFARTKQLPLSVETGSQGLPSESAIII